MRAEAHRIIAVLLLAGCAPEDACLEQARVRVVSPQRTRVATIYPGGCPDRLLAPQIIVEFRDQGGGGGVFAVRDSAAALGARWLGEDTLEVSYPPGLTIDMQRTTLQHGPARITVVYRETPHS